MTFLRSEGPITLRTLEETDVPLMARWRSDPRVLEFYSGRDRPLDEEGVRRHYLARSDEPVSGGVRDYQACIVEWNGRSVGFVQFYLLRPTDSERFGYPMPDRTFGIDFFIGETGLWGHGLGAPIITLAVNYLISGKSARRVVADPRTDNPRSIHTLEKVGFRKVRMLPDHEIFEGKSRDCWLMEYP